MDGRYLTKLPEDYYATKTYTDKLIGFIDANRGDGKPFFAYVAHQAPHDPYHLPKEWRKRHVGAYDKGWDAVRQERLKRQIELGIMPAVPMVVYALLGTSRPLSVSTTTTIAILAAAQLAMAAPTGDAAELLIAGATLAILVGAMLVLASVLRLGFVANFISELVVTGFKSGIGLVIVVDQIPKPLGVHIKEAGFFRDVLAIFHHLPPTSVATLVLVLALALRVLIFGLEHQPIDKERARQ